MYIVLIVNKYRSWNQQDVEIKLQRAKTDTYWCYQCG